jgi:sugar phosphate permease
MKRLVEILCLMALIGLVIAFPWLLIAATAIGMLLNALTGKSTGTHGGEPRDGDM